LKVKLVHVASQTTVFADQDASSDRLPFLLDRAGSYTPRAEDPNGDPVALSLSTKPTGMTYNSGTRVLSWTPKLAGEFPVAITATDTHGNQATQTFTLPVIEQAPANDAPVMTSIPSGPAYVGEVYEYQVEAFDPNNDRLQ